MEPHHILDKDGYRGGSSDSHMLAVAPSAELSTLVERTRKSLHDAVPPNTRRAYEGDLRRFAAWCTGAGLAAMPAAPGTIVLYMRHLADAGAKVSTIDRALAAVCSAHKRAGHASPWEDPMVADMRVALRRELGARPTKKRAADDEILRKLLGVLPPTLLGLRDRALLTLGWAAALRRSELVGLDVGDVTMAPKGLVVLIRGSKTDQERRGEEIPVFLSNLAENCPVRSLRAWLDASGIASGAIFRTLGRRGVLGLRLAPAAVAERVQHWASVAGLDATTFAGHSLRRGFITTAARKGKAMDSIQVVSRHRNLATLLGYIEHETLHERGAGEGLL
jgi:site-specific recombinase XerD